MRNSEPRDWSGGRPIFGLAVAGVGLGRGCWLILGAMVPALVAAGAFLGEA